MRQRSIRSSSIFTVSVFQPRLLIAARGSEPVFNSIAMPALELFGRAPNDRNWPIAEIQIKKSEMKFTMSAVSGLRLEDTS
jgi:hypothetical protein